jgi:hypothetical protein
VPCLSVPSVRWVASHQLEDQDMNDERDKAVDDEAGVETGQWQDDHDRLPQVDPPDEPKEPEE